MLDEISFIQNAFEHEFSSMIKDSNEELFFVCPFIKEDITKKILEFNDNLRIKILLNSNISNIYQNLTDFKAIKLLVKSGAEVRSMPNLHAKMYIFDNKKAIITSSNLTNAGLNSNIEFGVLINSENFIQGSILPILYKYWEDDKTVKIDDSELEKIYLDLKDYEIHNLSIPEVIPKKDKLHRLNYIRPKGEGYNEDYSDLSKTQRGKILGEKLMVQDLEEEEVKTIIENLFPGDEYKNSARYGIRNSYNSDDPFYTAGIYYKNILKVFEGFKYTYTGKIAIETFINMIFGTGRTNVEIKDHNTYLRIQSEYHSNFGLRPPKSIIILNSILDNPKHYEFLVNNPEYYVRLKNIFYFLSEDQKFEKLKNDILLDLKSKLTDLNDKKGELQDSNSINKMELAISRIKDIIPIVKED